MVTQKFKQSLMNVGVGFTTWFPESTLSIGGRCVKVQKFPQSKLRWTNSKWLISCLMRSSKTSQSFVPYACLVGLKQRENGKKKERKKTERVREKERYHHPWFLHFMGIAQVLWWRVYIQQVFPWQIQYVSPWGWGLQHEETVSPNQREQCPWGPSSVTSVISLSMMLLQWS